ncbi:hypothetical protein GCK32_019593 [Trichostrongylus colubriformis]|uniref:Uncharacterized protein n=1 Tax=Trichostrongylus colubriformis TaxID=6319 RepID=A0AAN8FDN0_TRICO
MARDSQRTRENEHAGTFAEFELVVTNNTSIFDTCPLKLYDHLDPQLLPFHNPQYNPTAGCKPYVPLTVLKNGIVRATEKAKEYRCSARYCLETSYQGPFLLFIDF